MKVSKAMVGRYVEIQWKDPSSARMQVKEALRGRAALATWVERGVIDDVTDGVVRIVHSVGTAAAEQAADEIQFTAVAEELIEEIKFFQQAPAVP